MKATEIIKPENQSAMQVLAFRVGERACCVDVANVGEILPHMEITRVPHAQSYVEGVLNLRGKILPVVCLKRRLGEKSDCGEGRSRIILLEVEKRRIGAMVDSVIEVLSFKKGEFTADSSGDPLVSSETTWNGERLRLLDISKVLALEQRTA